MPGAVYPDENICVLKVETDEIQSMEPCCGTHVRNTKELLGFHIISIKSGRHRDLYRLEAVSGLMAKNVSTIDLSVITLYNVIYVIVINYYRPIGASL